MGASGLSGAEARRLALAAQGFDRPRPRTAPDATALGATIERLGLLQIDYVNVLIPAQYQVLFSRLGPYEPALLDDLVYRRREFTEQWAHEASILPVASWPLLRHRMASHRVRPWGFEAFLDTHPAYVDWVLEQVRARGPLSALDLPEPAGVSRRLETAWYGTVPRAVLEALFGRGLLAVAERRRNFARAFDLAERVLPASALACSVGREEAQRTLLLGAARAHGVGSAGDLADYYRMPIREARARLAELSETGQLESVRVEGWREPAYLHPRAALPERIDAATLLSPFDPLIWSRARLARLFDFDYRFEIFVPERKRRWGCYVLPFLLGERLVARVDLKADRPGRRLRVLAAHLEAGVAAGAVVGALGVELSTLAAWLDLDGVAVGRRGGLARALAAAVRA